MADQAAAATQAGLSVDDDRKDSLASPESQIGSQSPISAINHAPQNPSASPMPLPPPQLAGMALPATPVASIAPTRGGATAPTRTREPDEASELSSLSSVATSPTQATPASTPDIQTLPLTPSPTNASAAAGPATSTQHAQATSSPPSPATQVAQAIAEPVKIVLTSPAQAGTTTPHVTTIQITPVELGRVEIRIERTNDGPAKIQLIAERSETLSRLVHDQSHLQQALDHAGIPQNSRTIEFSLAPAAMDGSSFSTSLSGKNTSDGESSSNGFQRQNNGYYNQALNEADDTKLGSTTHSRVIRTGIDITA